MKLSLLEDGMTVETTQRIAYAIEVCAWRLTFIFFVLAFIADNIALK